MKMVPWVLSVEATYALVARSATQTWMHIVLRLLRPLWRLLTRVSEIERLLAALVTTDPLATDRGALVVWRLGTFLFFSFFLLRCFKKEVDR